MRRGFCQAAFKWLPVAAGLIFFFFVFCFISMPVCAEESVVTNINYYDRSSGEPVKMVCPEAINLSTVSDNTIGDGNWYVVTETLTLKKRLKISGVCNLILGINGKLFCSKGISCNKGNTLNIFSENTLHRGRIECDISEDNYAAIGGTRTKAAEILLFTMQGFMRRATGAEPVLVEEVAETADI